MTLEVFKNQITRLENIWKGAYPEERKKLLFASLKSMPDHWMEQTVSAFMFNRQAPMLKEFLESVSEYQDKNIFDNALPQGMKTLPEVDCGNCGGSGYATETDAKGYRFIARCYCEVGRARSNKLYGPRHTTDPNEKREEYFIKDYRG